ncbi:MAG: transcriptional repressor [Deltaproteobacteria bacterium]|nr:transcriptional repressor [Deltaproteobacteria bacterium]MBW2017622.1 transcriptional repressor [Deltaproteobacteria bacterium]MBW2128391.1 transcriptional repressor [Deltaproteobacteria bacterium]MBW2304923.1 transcriptional repressor [Deltaproteobacteria bacterium]
MGTDKKYRMTDQRRVILEEVRKSCDHPTADEIYERVKRRLPRISLGTVYRNLDMLAGSGLIKKLEPGRTLMRYDGNTSQHYHTICVRCGKVDDTPVEPVRSTLDLLEKVVGKLTRYGIFGHKLEFLGLCKDCRVREDED